MCSVNVKSLHITELLHNAGQVFSLLAQGEEETFTGVRGDGKVFVSSYGWRSVGVAQHRMEGAGEVVGVVAAVVLLRHWNQAGQADEQQEEQVDRERGPEDPTQEGLVLGGGGGGGAIRKVRTGGNAASGAW